RVDAGQVHARTRRIGHSARPGRLPSRLVLAIAGGIRHGRSGRRHRWTIASAAGPVGGTPTADAVCLSGASGSEHAADHLPAGYQRQLAGGAAAGEARLPRLARIAIEESVTWTYCRSYRRCAGTGW